MMILFQKKKSIEFWPKDKSKDKMFNSNYISSSSSNSNSNDKENLKKCLKEFSLQNKTKAQINNDNYTNPFFNQIILTKILIMNQKK